ncbi:MAG: aconitate hydratase [Pseudomonadota bacterium]
MGMTLTEKLIKGSLVEGEMTAGKRIGIRADQTLSHDVNGVMTYQVLQAIGLDKVKVDLAVHYIDHNMIQADFKNSDDHKYLQDITAKLGVICSRPGSGICHMLQLEHFARPGKTLIGGDSHTVAAGGIGMLSVGVGGFDSAMAIAGEPLYMTMPKIVNVHLTGKLPAFVSAKNIILEVLRRISVNGGVGKILEYTGPGVATLNVTERSSITNMGQETGATTSVFPSDENTRKWMKAYGREEQWIKLEADPDAVYDEVIEINLSELEPLIALPHQPDKVVPVREVAGTKVDQVMMGSCTNTSLQDVLSIAHILDGKTVHRDVDAGLYPSTRTVIRESIRRGAYEKILASGVRIFEPICGGCNGSGFAPKTNGVSLRTTPRNFVGRSGTATDKVYLVAPEVAAASAITGVITDPRSLNLKPFEYDMPDIFVDDRDIFQQPSAEPESVVIRRGPNHKPIPDMPALADTITGEALLKLGDDITTDHICPAGGLYLPIRSNIPELSKHAFKVVDDTFAERAHKAGLGFIVAGKNYGQGSSREQAAMVPRYLGVKAVIAKSFARLHLANMVNWGLLPLTFANFEDYDKLEQGDVLVMDTAELLEGQIYKLRVMNKDVEIQLVSPLCQADLDSIKAGGRLNQVKAKL